MPALNLKSKNLCEIQENGFEPVKLFDNTYGKDITFDHSAQKVTFTSNFHGPKHLSYEKIKKISVKEVNRKKWIIISALLCIFVIGIPFLFGALALPKFLVKLSLENPQEKQQEVSIRARFNPGEADLFAKFLKQKFKVHLELL